MSGPAPSLSSSLRRHARSRKVLAGAAVVAGAWLVYKACKSDSLRRALAPYKRMLAAMHGYYKAFLLGGSIAPALMADLQVNPPLIGTSTPGGGAGSTAHQS